MTLNAARVENIMLLIRCSGNDSLWESDKADTFELGADDGKRDSKAGA